MCILRVRNSYYVVKKLVLNIGIKFSTIQRNVIALFESYYVVKKLVLNIDFKAFWYSKKYNIKPPSKIFFMRFRIICTISFFITLSVRQFYKICMFLTTLISFDDYDKDTINNYP